MNQTTIGRAVNIATKAALAGTPVYRVIYLPPTLATQDPRGGFAIEYCEPLSASETPPWEK